MLTGWSLSRLHDYEKCPHMIKLKVIDKIPEEKNKWAERGTEVHGKAESFVRSEIKVLPEELNHFKNEFYALRNMYDRGAVSMEGEWAHGSDWSITDWRDKNTWLRLKLDVMARLTKTHAAVIDHKTGKMFGNEIKHAEQGQLYAGSTFLRYPELKVVTVEFWYLDKNEMTQVVYTPQQAAKFIMGFERRANRMLADKKFQARPSIFSCKLCPYRRQEAGGNGACKFAIIPVAAPPKREA